VVRPTGRSPSARTLAQESSPPRGTDAARRLRVRNQ